MEIARHWRNSRRNLRLEGLKRTISGCEEISTNGFTWHEAPSNGHSRENKSSSEVVIYQAPANGGNGHSHELIKTSKSTKPPLKSVKKSIFV